MSARPFVIGVTGPIASGKSAVTRRLAEHGAAVIDADLVYRELVGPGMELTRRLATRFGEGVISPDGSLNRRALGSIVFSDANALSDLDHMTHPVIIAEIGERVSQLVAPLAVIEAVKLSSGTARFCDETWLIEVDPSAQIERLMRRNGIDRAESERRVAAQKHYDHTDYTRTIRNDGTLDELNALVDGALNFAISRRVD